MNDTLVFVVVVLIFLSKFVSQLLDVCQNIGHQSEDISTWKPNPSHYSGRSTFPLAHEADDIIVKLGSDHERVTTLNLFESTFSFFFFSDLTSSIDSATEPTNGNIGQRRHAASKSGKRKYGSTNSIFFEREYERLTGVYLQR